MAALGIVAIVSAGINTLNYSQNRVLEADLALEDKKAPENFEQLNKKLDQLDSRITAAADKSKEALKETKKTIKKVRL